MENRRKRLQIRDERRKRQTRIWSVLFFLSSYNEITSREWATKKQQQNYENAQNALREYRPVLSDIKTAIRFCKIEHYKGTCSRGIKDTDLHLIFAEIKKVLAS